MVREKEVKEVINTCIKALNDTHQNIKFTVGEVATIAAQLLIIWGSSIALEDIDPYNMDIKKLYNKYYAESGNDMGLGMLLNGVSMMSAIDEQIKESVCDETATQT
jgi:hypothetical protein